MSREKERNKERGTGTLTPSSQSLHLLIHKFPHRICRNCNFLGYLREACNFDQIIQDVNLSDRIIGDKKPESYKITSSLCSIMFKLYFLKTQIKSPWAIFILSTY
jgi:hypothetical protein